MLVDDITSVSGKTILTTATPHTLQKSLLRQGKLKIFQVLLTGTGHPFLDSSSGEKLLLAKVHHEKQLQLLDETGSHLRLKLETSTGTLQLPLSSSRLLHGWLVPVLVQIPLLGLGIILVAIWDLSAYEITTMLCAGIVLASLWRLWVKVYYPQVKGTRLSRKLGVYAEKCLKRFPEPLKTETGQGRAVRLRYLLEILEDFKNFVDQRNMYYVAPNVVKPLTADLKLSFSEFVGPATVEWFVSHWWGEFFPVTVRSLSKHAAAVREDDWESVPYWICTFSNNQHLLSEEIPGKLEESSFYKTLYSGFCHGVCMIMDERAEPLTRSWCIFELLQCLGMQESELFPDFQGLLFCSPSGVMNWGHATSEVSMGIGRKLTTFSLESATASRQEDKDMIDTAVVTTMGGFKAMDAKVRRSVAAAIQTSKTRIDCDFSKLHDRLNESVLELTNLMKNKCSNSEALQIPITVEGGENGNGGENGEGVEGREEQVGESGEGVEGREEQVELEIADYVQPKMLSL